MTRTVCAWCSRSTPARQLVLTVISVICSAGPALGTTYVPMADSDLLAQTPLVVEGRVLSVAEAPVTGRPATDYTVEVVRSLKGTPQATPLTVRVPGGRTAEGAVFRVWGAAEAPGGGEGDPLPRPAGRRHAGPPAAHAGSLPRGGSRGPGGRGARPVGRLRVVARDGTPAAADPAGKARDFRAFADWLADRGSITGTSGTSPKTTDAPYWVAVTPGGEARLASRYTLLGSNGQNFRWFNGGGTWFAYQSGQSGMAGGGFAEVQAALAAWNADPGSNLSLSYGGTTSRASGFRANDGANVVLFDDPNGEITGSFSCTSGGVLAIGGFSGVSRDGDVRRKDLLAHRRGRGGHPGRRRLLLRRQRREERRGCLRARDRARPRPRPRLRRRRLTLVRRPDARRCLDARVRTQRRARRPPRQ